MGKKKVKDSEIEDSSGSKVKVNNNHQYSLPESKSVINSQPPSKVSSALLFFVLITALSIILGLIIVELKDSNQDLINNEQPDLVSVEKQAQQPLKQAPLTKDEVPEYSTSQKQQAPTSFSPDSSKSLKMEEPTLPVHDSKEHVTEQPPEAKRRKHEDEATKEETPVPSGTKKEDTLKISKEKMQELEDQIVVEKLITSEESNQNNPSEMKKPTSNTVDNQNKETSDKQPKADPPLMKKEEGKNSINGKSSSKVSKDELETLYLEVEALADEILKEQPENEMVKQLAPHLEGVLKHLESGKLSGLNVALNHIKEILLDLKNRLATSKNKPSASAEDATTSHKDGNERLPVNEVIPDPVYIAPLGNKEDSNSVAQESKPTVQASNFPKEKSKESTEKIFETRQDTAETKKPEKISELQTKQTSDAKEKAANKDSESPKPPNKVETFETEKANNQKDFTKKNSSQKPAPKDIQIEESKDKFPSQTKDKSGQKVHEEIKLDESSIYSDVSKKKDSKEKSPGTPKLKDAQISTKPRESQEKLINVQAKPKVISTEPKAADELSNPQVKNKVKFSQVKPDKPVKEGTHPSPETVKKKGKAPSQASQTDSAKSDPSITTQKKEPVKSKLATAKSISEEALSIYNKILDKNPKEPGALFGKANSLARLSEVEKSNPRLEDAIHAYLDIIDLADTSPTLVPKDILREASVAFTNKIEFRGWFKTGLETLESILLHFPGDLEFLRKKGLFYLSMNNAAPAKNIYEEILEKAPEDWLSQARYGFILKLESKSAEELRKAVSHLAPALQSGTPEVITDNRYYYHLGDAYQRLGEYQKAYEYLVYKVDADLISLLSLGGDNAPPEVITDNRYYYHLGDAYQRLGEYQKAYELFDLGVANNLFLSRYQRSIYNVEKLKAKPVWTQEETTYGKFFKKLEGNWKKIADEATRALEINNGTHIVSAYEEEDENLSEKGMWGVFTLFSKGKKNILNCNLTPFTCSLIEAFPPAATCKRGQAKFSVLSPGVHVFAHSGPTNCRLRAHLGLLTPANVSMRVVNRTLHWKEGKIFIFDDSFEHELWHNGSSIRVILIVDVWHPELSLEEKRSLPAI